MQFTRIPVTFPHPDLNILIRIRFLNILSLSSSLRNEAEPHIHVKEQVKPYPEQRSPYNKRIIQDIIRQVPEFDLLLPLQESGCNY
jgi:hypothetical protein